MKKKKNAPSVGQEELLMVMDDTVNIGKEPYQFQTEQEKIEFDIMIERILKELGWEK